MATYIAVCCHGCRQANVIKHGKTRQGVQRYRCLNLTCKVQTFLLDYQNKGAGPFINSKIIAQSLRSSGIRDIAETQKVSIGKVIRTIKARAVNLPKANWERLKRARHASILTTRSQVDEQWSFVFSKKQQRWLWVAICDYTGEVLAYTFGRRTDEACRRLLSLLRPFKLTHFFSDDWGSYKRLIEKGKHSVGKKFTQRVERFFLTLRTHIKRLVRKTICFSKSDLMHDTVIGLYITTNFFWSNSGDNA